MLQPQPKQSVSHNKTDNVPPFGQQQQLSDSDGAPSMEVVLIEGEKRISMKRSQPNMRGNNGMMINPFGKIKVQTALDGNHAQLRVSDTTPEFEISLPTNVNAADYLVLIKLSPKSDRREVEVGRAGITGTSQGFRKEAIVPTTFAEVKTQSNERRNEIYPLSCQSR